MCKCVIFFFTLVHIEMKNSTIILIVILVLFVCGCLCAYISPYIEGLEKDTKDIKEPQRRPKETGSVGDKKRYTKDIKKEERQLKDPPETKPKKSGLSTSGIIIMVGGGLLLVIGLIGGGIWLVMKMQKVKKKRIEAARAEIQQQRLPSSGLSKQYHGSQKKLAHLLGPTSI